MARYENISAHQLGPTREQHEFIKALVPLPQKTSLAVRDTPHLQVIIGLLTQSMWN